MNQKRLGVLLGAEGVVCLAAALLLPVQGNPLPALAAFPFAQIGWGLRKLSLSGGTGNAAAVLLYALLCLLPLAGLGLRRLRGQALHREDGLLFLLSPVLFGVLYGMINPAVLAGMLGGAGMEGAGKAMAGLTVWSLLAAWIILRLLRAFGSGGPRERLRWLGRLLSALCVLLTAAGVLSVVWGGRGAVAELAASNTDVPVLGLAFAWLGALVKALSHGLELWLLWGALPLLTALTAEPFGPEVSPAALRLAGRCKAAVAALVLSQAGFNLLQLLLAWNIRSSALQLSLPLFDLGVVLAVLLLADYLARSRALQEENDSFI